jgi:hypothetical protein
MFEMIQVAKFSLALLVDDTEYMSHCLNVGDKFTATVEEVGSEVGIEVVGKEVGSVEGYCDGDDVVEYETLT